MVGVIVSCPITSGDTAFRSARLVLADWFKIDQNKMQKRLVLCVPLLAVGAFVGHLDYSIVWRYFSWTNQTLVMIVCGQQACICSMRRRITGSQLFRNIYERRFHDLLLLRRRMSGILYNSSLSGRHYSGCIVLVSLSGQQEKRSQ